MSLRSSIKVAVTILRYHGLLGGNLNSRLKCVNEATDQLNQHGAMVHSFITIISSL